MLLHIKNHDKMFILGGMSIMYTFIPRDHFVGGSETGGASQDRFSISTVLQCGGWYQKICFRQEKNIYSYLMETRTVLNDELIII